MNDLKEAEELAHMFKNGNIKEIAQLAEGFLKLKAQYDVLEDRLFKMSSDKVMEDHSELFRKLAKYD